MGFNNKYPYTDFHEMNLDWILEVVKRIETEWPEFKTTLENEWNEYKDELTGEGGEWPTFKTQIETTINNFIHDVIGDYNEDLDYKTGMFCYHEGTVYKCVQISSAAFPRPFNSYGWFSYSGQDLHSVLNDLFNTVTSAINDQNRDIASWIVRTAAQWDPTTSYTVGDYCSAYIGGGFNPFTWHYYKCIQDCTNVSVYDTNYWKEVVFASDVAETMAAYKQAMQDQYDQFLEDYQRTFGVVQVRGSSTTDVMSQKAVSDELDAIDRTLNTIDGAIDTIDGDIDTINNTLDDIKIGNEIVGHADVADNLSPYSEDSGTTQENPFISQGTGTNNNSVIVTTGTIARQLEKQGNTLPVMQLLNPTNFRTRTTYDVTITNNNDGTLSISGTAYTLAYLDFTTNNFDLVTGHKYILMSGNPSIDVICYDGNLNRTANGYALFTASSNSAKMQLPIAQGVTYNGKIRPVVFDITSLDADIITDLTSHPEHFSWYYNGSLAYDAGSLQNCNGRYLECGQSRNLFNGIWTNNTALNPSTGAAGTQNGFSASDWVPVIPNRDFYYRISATDENMAGTHICYYDKDKNFIAGYTHYVNYNFWNRNKPAPANAWFIRVDCGNVYKGPVCISLYYTPEEGGEGYDQYYPYIAPIRIDTGNEPLKAFDKKLPSGVITKGTGEYTFTGNESWVARGGTPDVDYYVCTLSLPDGGSISENKTKGIASCNILFGNGYSGGVANLIELDGYRAYISVARGISPNSILTSSVTIQYELGTSATEQGTPFSEYAPINDYSYMAWFDSDGNLVSIPQGCKLFYPVNYKGFTDDLVMYTNGDATALAKNEDITDSALNARGYYKMQDLLVEGALEINNSNYSLVSATINKVLLDKATRTIHITFYGTIHVEASSGESPLKLDATLHSAVLNIMNVYKYSQIYYPLCYYGSAGNAIGTFNISSSVTTLNGTTRLNVGDNVVQIYAVIPLPRYDS